MKVKVSGILTLKSPLHISSPERDFRYMPDTGRIVRGAKGGAGFPCTVTRAETIRTPLAVTETNPLGRVRLPVMPAQGIKGAIRRSAEEIIRHNLANRGLMPKAATYQAMRTGAVSGRPDSTIPSTDEAKARMEHHFAGLFGGGSQIVPGRVYAKPARVVADAYIDLGTVPDGLCDPVPATTAYQLFDAVPVVRKDDLMQNPSRDAFETIEDYNEYMLSLIAEAVQRRKSKRGEDAEGDDSNSPALQAISYAEVVIPGTEFYFEVGAEDANEEQAGMLIDALALWLARGHHGGKHNLGLGEFSHSLTVEIDGEQYSDVFSSQVDEGLSDECPDEIVTLVSKAHEAIERSMPEDYYKVMVEGGK